MRRRLWTSHLVGLARQHRSHFKSRLREDDEYPLGRVGRFVASSEVHAPASVESGVRDQRA